MMDREMDMLTIGNTSMRGMRHPREKDKQHVQRYEIIVYFRKKWFDISKAQSWWSKSRVRKARRGQITEGLAITCKKKKKKIGTSTRNKGRYQRFKLQSPTDAQIHAFEKITLGAACTLGGIQGGKFEGRITMERTGWTSEPFGRCR